MASSKKDTSKKSILSSSKMPLLGRHLYVNLDRILSYRTCRGFFRDSSDQNKEVISVISPLSDSDGVIIDNPLKWLRELRDFELDHARKTGNSRNKPNLLSVCTIMVPPGISMNAFKTFCDRVTENVLHLNGLPFMSRAVTRGDGTYIEFIFSERPYHTQKINVDIRASRDFFKDPATNKLVSAAFPGAVCFRKKGDIIRTESVHFEGRKKDITRFANKGEFLAYISKIKMFCKDFFDAYCSNSDSHSVNDGALTLRVDGNKFCSHAMKSKAKAFNSVFIDAEKAINNLIYVGEMAGIDISKKITGLIMKLRSFQELFQASFVLNSHRHKFSISPFMRDFEAYLDNLDVLRDLVRNDIDVIMKKNFSTKVIFGA